MKVGDSVKFVGHFCEYISSYRHVLKRTGEVMSIPDSGLYKGKIQVCWKPKTRRGFVETAHHKPEELELMPCEKG